MTSFEEQVYSITKKIPKGKVTTYKEIAQALGKPKAFRAVGNALNKNPFAPQVPCHRVIKSDGSLGGFAQGQSKKKKLLLKEGIIVKNNRVEDMRQFMIRVSLGRGGPRLTLL